MFENLKKKLKGIFSKSSEQIEEQPVIPETTSQPALPPVPPAPAEIPPPPLIEEPAKVEIPMPEEEKEIVAAVEKDIEKVEVPPQAEAEEETPKIPEEAEREILEKVTHEIQKDQSQQAAEKQLVDEVKKALEKVDIPPPPPTADIEKEIQEVKRELKEEKVPSAPPKEEKPTAHSPSRAEREMLEAERRAPHTAIKEKERFPLATPSKEKEKPHAEGLKPKAEKIEIPPPPTPRDLVKEIESEIEPQEEKGGILKLFSKLTHKEISEKDLAPILWELEVALLENDVAKEVSEKLISEVKTALLSKKAKRGSVDEIIKNALKKAVKSILSAEPPDILKLIKHKKEKPFVIMFFGFNGTGKTMTIGKFAKLLQDNKIPVVMAAGDTFRAAAIEQLEVHATNLKVPIIKQKKGSDAAAVIFDAVKHAKAKGVDVVLADTAGRSHTNANLMDELKKIVRVNKPDLKIFVGDSLTGNDAAEQAKMFNDAVGIDASVLTKVDTDPKGGACLSVAYVTGKPILYLGTGQNYGDMIPFSAKWFVEKVF